MIKKMCCLLTAVLLTFSLFASPSYLQSEPEYDIPELIKHEDAMLWEINGTDSNGNPSKLYVLGSIHVGDDRLYPLPESITKAYESSDRYVAELSTLDFGKMISGLMERQAASMEREAARAAATGKPLLSYFTEDEIKFLETMYGSIQIVNQLALYEPWVLMNGLSVLPIITSGLDPEKGIDSYFINLISQNNKFVEGLDSLDTQLDLLEFGDWDTQLAMLKDLIKEYMADPNVAGKELNDLYNTYLTFDEAKVCEVINAELEADEEYDYSDEYNNTLIVNRNIAWAHKFDDYLKQGGTTFIFAGTAHFVGEDSVFDIMKENGTLR